MITTFPSSNMTVSSLSQILYQISDEIINKMKAACVSKNAKKLYKILLTILYNNIYNLDLIFLEAVKQKCSEIISNLIH